MHAGNIDNKEMVAGTTLFIPVNSKGANFEVGDGHAGQGNGEVDITALETQLTGTSSSSCTKIHISSGRAARPPLNTSLWALTKTSRPPPKWQFAT
jgi:acetamidase/formamidase